MRGLLRIAATLGAAVLAGAALAHPEDVAPEAAPRFEPPPAGSYELPPIDRVSDHELVDSEGKAARLLDLAPGEAALVSFVYLSCADGCPLATATLRRVDRELAADPVLGRRVHLVSVSLDPHRDTPERLREARQGLDPRGRWRFVTATGPASLRPVLADFGQDAHWMVGHEGVPDRLRHVLKIFLVDDARRVRNVYSTGLLDPRLVLNDLRTVLGP